MSDTHIFQCSGDSCPICVALDGSEVPAGYEAHPGCACSTIPKGDDDTCEWDVEHTGNLRDGNRSFDVISGFEVTVTCPDGSSAGASGTFDGHPYNDVGGDALAAWSDGFTEAAEALAQELCDACLPKEPFLCC